jgi:hypothetical protein
VPRPCGDLLRHEKLLCIGMLGAEEALAVGHHLLSYGGGLDRAPRRAGGRGQVGQYGQGVRVLSAEDALTVDHDLLENGDGVVRGAIDQ